MICPFCKNEIPDESTFCLKCGSKIESIDVQDKEVKSEEIIKNETNNDVELEIENIVNNDSNDTKKKRKKIPVVIAIILAVVLLIVLGCFCVYKFVLPNNNSNIINYQTVPKESYLDLEGNAYFTINGNVVKIPGDYKSAYSSKNGQNFVCLDADGTLFYFSSPTAEKVKIDVDIDSIECVTDSAVFYATYTGEAPTVDEVLARAMKDRDKSERSLDDDDYYDLFRLLHDNTYDDAKDYYSYLTGNKFPEDEYIKVVYHKYTYSTQSAIELVYAGQYVFSDKASIAATIDSSNSIVAYMPDSDSQKELCKVSESAELINFNDDLTNVIWYEIEEKKKSEVVVDLADEEQTSIDKVSTDKDKDKEEDELVKVCSIFRISNGQKERLGDLGEVSEYGIGHGCYVQAYFINGGKDFIIYGNSSPSIIIGGIDREPHKIDFPDTVVRGMTDKGDILGGYYGHNFEISNVERILVEVDGEDNLDTIYQIDFNGEKSKLLSRVSKLCGIYDNSLLYIDQDKVLQICDWSNGVINNELRVTSETVNAEITPDGKYILISKNMGNPDYDLYYVELKATDYTPAKIHSNVMNYYFTGKKGELYIIADANEIINYKNGKAGDLYLVNLGKQTKKITKDVVALDTIYDSNIIADNIPIVIKFSYVDSSHNNARIYDMGIIKDATYSKIYGDVVDKYDK